MSNTMRFQTDNYLLAMAKELLIDAGFVYEDLDLGEESGILAENKYSIVALATTSTILGLERAESQLATCVRERIQESELGPKSWDIYLVVITQDAPSDQDSDVVPLFQINYDTSGFRRILRAGVKASDSDLRRALVTFVELPNLESTNLSLDPLSSLSSALTTHGIEEDTVSRAIEVFREGGVLSDAI